MESLHMEECDTIYIEANRSNICYSVKEITGLHKSNFDTVMSKALVLLFFQIVRCSLPLNGTK